MIHRKINTLVYLTASFLLLAACAPVMAQVPNKNRTTEVKKPAATAAAAPTIEERIAVLEKKLAAIEAAMAKPPATQPSSPSPAARLMIGTSDLPLIDYAWCRAASIDISITYGGLDANDDAVWDGPASLAGITCPADFNGVIGLDWEGEGYARLQLVGTKTQAAIMGEMIRAIDAVKSKYPKAQVGYYGVPMTRYWMRDDPQWLAINQSLIPLIQHCDVLLPSLYDYYAPADHAMADARGAAGMANAGDEAVAADNVAMALRISAEAGGNRPVLPYVWGRYHDSNALYGLQRIPDGEAIGQWHACLASSWGGRTAAGLVYWDCTQDVYRASKKTLPPTDPGYAGNQKAIRAMAAEIPRGVAIDVYTEWYYRRIIALLMAARDGTAPTYPPLT